MKVIDPSETAEKHILTVYPHLSKEDILHLFNHGNIISNPGVIRDKNIIHCFNNLKLFIPNEIATIYKVDTKIDILIGDDNIICKKVGKR